MEGTEVNQAIEKIDETVNITEENESLLTIVLPTIVILLLLKKILKYNSNNNQNERLNINEDGGNRIQRMCPIYEAMCLAAVDTSNEKSSLSLDTSKHNSHIPGHHHSHIHSLISLYDKCGIKGVKKFLHYSIIHFNPISVTITNKKELKYYKKRLIEVETLNKKLGKQLNFCIKKGDELSNQLECEKNAREIKENCLKESNKKMEKNLAQYMTDCEECKAKCEEYKAKCEKLESDNECLKNQIKILKEKLSKNSFEFVSYNSNEYLQDQEENSDYESDYSEDDCKQVCTSIVFKRQEEQRQNEEEANKLLSDLDKRGIDDFILEIKEGKSKFSEVAPLILNQMIIDDLDVVHVSIELDKFVKKCDTKKKEVLSAIIDVICKLIEKKEQRKSSICAFEVIRKYVALLQEYIGNSKKDKLQFLTLIFNHCKSVCSLKSVFINIIDKLYKLNLIDASTILDWYSSCDKESLKGVLENEEAVSSFLESLTYEDLKKNILLKKEYNSYEEFNDSGFCSNDEDDKKWLSDEDQLSIFNLDYSLLVDDHFNSCDRLKNQNTHCYCCNCNHNNSYDSFMLKEKSTGRVRFIIDNEQEIPSDHLLLQDSNNEDIILKEDSGSNISDYSVDDRCLLDIVEDFDEEDSLSFFIQEINDEPIFNKNILDGECCCSNSTVSDNSSESSILIEEQDFSFNENCEDLNEELKEKDIIEGNGVIYNSINEEELKKCLSENSFVTHQSICHEEIEEEEIDEEIYIVNKKYGTVNHIEFGEDEYEDEEENEQDFEEEIKNIDIEICFEEEIEEEIEEEEEEEEEDDDDDESEVEINFESDANENEDDEIEINFERITNEDEENEDEESVEEEDEEEEVEIEDKEDTDFEICFEDEDREDNDSTNDDESDSYDEEEDESEEDESEEDESEEKEIINYKRRNSDNEICDYLSEHEQSSNCNRTEKVFQLSVDSESESELECESDSEESEVDDDIEIAFERPYDAENEICSDDSAYDSESESGSDTEFDDDKIERIASLRSVLPSDEYTYGGEGEELDDEENSSNIKKLHCFSSESSETLENNIENLEDPDENIEDHHQSSGINSDLDEIIYDSDFDIVFCSSDCTIEISDDQGEVNYCNDKILRTSSVSQIQDNGEENNVELYPNLEKMKEDGQRKYINRNNKKKNNFIRKDSGLQKLISLYCSEPEVKHEIDNVLGKYDQLNNSTTNSSKYCGHPKLLQFNHRKMKKLMKKNKKHCIKNENFLNRSHLRNII